MILLNSQLQNHIISSQNDDEKDNLEDTTDVQMLDRSLVTEDGDFNVEHNLTQKSKKRIYPISISYIKQSLVVVTTFAFGYYISWIQCHPLQLQSHNANYEIVISTYYHNFRRSVILTITILVTMYIIYMLITSMTRYYNQQIQDCIHRVQVALGSINAPPLNDKLYYYYHEKLINQSSPYSKRNEIKFYNKIVSLVEKHTVLLKTIDHAIQLIRISTSIQLGLGPWSLSVDRIETKYSSTKSERGKTTSCVSTTINLHHIRKMIFDILIKQMKSIQNIQSHILSLRYDDKCRENDVLQENENDDLYDTTSDTLLYQKFLNHLSLQESTILTISLIKSIRLYVGELLSKTLSLCMRSTTLLSLMRNNNNDDDDDLVRLVSSSTSMADEMVPYINSFLPPITSVIVKEGDDNNNKRGTTNEERKKLLQLQKHVDGLYTTIWAFQQSIYNQTTKSNNDDDDQLNEETRIFWNRMGDSIQNVSDLYLSLNNQYYNKNETMKLRNDDPTEAHGNDMEMRHVIERVEYNNKGVDRPTILTKDNDSLPKDKILVFAGKGVKSHHRYFEKGEKKESSKSSTNVLGMNNYAADQAILLRELQSRIQVLDKADEWDAITNQNIDKNLDNELLSSQEVKSVTQTSHSSPFFLGASGSLLSELKNALSNPAIITRDNDHT